MLSASPPKELMLDLPTDAGKSYDTWEKAGEKARWGRLISGGDGIDAGVRIDMGGNRGREFISVLGFRLCLCHCFCFWL